MLMRRIREDVQHRRAAMGERRPVDAARSELPQRRRRLRGAEIATDLRPLPRLAESAGIIERKQKYSLEDFLHFNDEDFIRNAYRGVLRREADADGSGPFLEGLRTGHMAKSEILGRLRYSAEGRACGVPIRGLPLAFALRTARHAPLIGRLLGIAQYVIRLPEIVRNHERLEAEVFHQRFELARGVNTLGAQIDDRQSRIATSVDRAIESLDATIAELQERQEIIVHERQQPSGELRTAIDSLRKDKMDRVEAMDSAHKTDTALAELQRAVSASQTQLAAMKAAAELEDAEAHLLDPFYVALEDRFRGTHEDIKSRVATHLPTIHAAGAGTADAPIVDIGCGRGEWLELLREQDLIARGVDLNRLMIEKCRARGLDVTAVDAIDYLRAAAADSLGAVTGIHIIEHLSFRQLIRLIDETYRALRAGGVAIFETPNPENLIVGACNFWSDPTHHKPLPPEMMRFIFEARAFTRVEVIRLHPFPYELHLSEGPAQLRSRLNELLYGWQDYAIVAHKD
jgi:SAM-dependent methyltransferase